MFNRAAWCDRFINETNKRQMTLNESKTMFGLMFEPNFVADDSLKEEFGFRLMSKRSEVMGLKLSDRLILMLMLITACNPGEMVMYLTAIRSKTQECDLHEFCNIFPVGFLTEDDLHLMWTTQKVPGGNGLDIDSSW